MKILSLFKFRSEISKGRGAIISPLPFTKLVWLSIKNGQSLPISDDSDFNFLFESPSSQSSFIALSINAPSELPPPNPAPVGIFLRSLELISGRLNRLLNNSWALTTVFE